MIGLVFGLGKDGDNADERSSSALGGTGVGVLPPGSSTGNGTDVPTLAPVMDTLVTTQPTVGPIAPLSVTNEQTENPIARPATDSPMKQPTLVSVKNSPTYQPTPWPTKDLTLIPSTLRPTSSSLMTPVVDRSCEYQKSQDVIVSAPVSFLALSSQQMYGGTSDFDGNHAVVVAYEEGSLYGAGAVWVLGKDAGGTWEQVGSFQSDTTEQFGWDIAIRGSTLVIGAPGYEGTSTITTSMLDVLWVGKGRVYVMAKDGDGSWYRQAILSPSVADWNANFGKSVDVAGELKHYLCCHFSRLR